MNVIDLKKFGDRECLKTIEQRYRFKPYWWIRQVDEHSRCQLMERHLEQVQENDTAVILGAFTDDEELAGFATMNPLPWDTEHFAVDIWRVGHLGVWGEPQQQRETAGKLTQAVVRQAARHGAQALTIWEPLDAIGVIHALEAGGFRTMESQVYWLYDLQRQPLQPPKTNALFRPHTPADTEALMPLARRVYTPIPDRFHADPHFPTAVSDDLYARWLHNSCTGEAADYISVLEVDGEVVGYATLRYLDDQAGLCNVHMGQFLLGAIEPRYRQAGGVYDDLLRSLLVWLVDRHADLAFVGTQTNNAAAQCGMARMGWRPVCGGLSLHFWQE
jgi:hypothetical protein